MGPGADKHKTWAIQPFTFASVNCHFVLKPFAAMHSLCNALHRKPSRVVVLREWTPVHISWQPVSETLRLQQEN